MDNIDLIIANAAQVITCASNGKPKKGNEMAELGMLAGNSIAVDKGRIVEVGSNALLDKKYSATKTIDASQMVVTPGLIDPHTHLVYGGNRFAEFEQRIKGLTYLEIMEAGGGINSTVMQTRESSVEDLTNEAIVRLKEMCELGATTVEIKTGYGLDCSTEIKMLEVIENLSKISSVRVIPTFLAAHAIPSEWKGKEDEFTSHICDEMIPAAWNWYEKSSFKQTGTPFFVDVFCEKNAFNLLQTQKILTAGKEQGFQIKAHVDEFTNLGGAECAIALGATSIDHLDTINDCEIELLAESETIGIVTPAVNFNLGSCDFADARKLIDSGCAVALSTDYNPGSAPTPSIPMSMAIACRYQKLLPAEALSASTVNAAFAVGCGDTSGSIERGKLADLVIWKSHDYRQIAYDFGRNCVAKVIIGGETVFSALS